MKTGWTHMALCRVRTIVSCLHVSTGSQYYCAKHTVGACSPTTCCVYVESHVK